MYAQFMQHDLPVMRPFRPACVFKDMTDDIADPPQSEPPDLTDPIDVRWTAPVVQTSGCCDEQTCCEPSAKSACCGPGAAGDGCGCR
jgi:hypothetical protein